MEHFSKYSSVALHLSPISRILNKTLLNTQMLGQMLGSCLHKKGQVAYEIFHGITHESIAWTDPSSMKS